MPGAVVHDRLDPALADRRPLPGGQRLHDQLHAAVDDPAGTNHHFKVVRLRP